MNRAILREIIFKDKSEKQWLEDLLHPLIIKRMYEMVDAIENAPYCIVMIPLLLEVGGFNRIDRILVIESDKELQVQRLRQRDNIEDETIDAILSTQATSQLRLAHADDIIYNNGSVKELENKVESLHRFYSALAQGKEFSTS